MSLAPRAVVFEMMDRFAVVFGSPNNRTPLEMCAVWQVLIEDMTDDDIRYGAVMLGKFHKFGFPTPAHLREAACGRVIKIPKHRPDGYGGFQLKNGARIIEGWHEVNVPLDWDGDPAEYTERDIDQLEALMERSRAKVLALPERVS